MTGHWIQRVNERIGNVDPSLLWDGLQWAIDQRRTDLVEYVGRTSREGTRAFRFCVPDGRTFVAIINTNLGVPITVLDKGEFLAGNSKFDRKVRVQG